MKKKKSDSKSLWDKTKWLRWAIPIVIAIILAIVFTPKSNDVQINDSDNNIIIQDNEGDVSITQELSEEKDSPAAIIIKGGSGASIEDNTFIGYDTAVDVEDHDNLYAEGNTIIK